jgi:Protein of unknown function (DUF2911)
MRSLVPAALVLTLAVPAASFAAARGTAKATVAGKEVSIDYGRPELQGRDMLAKLSVGDSWRLGADSPTALKTAADLSFGAVVVPAGEYVLKLTRGDGDTWLLNVLRKSAAGAGDKLVDVPLKATPIDASVETFTMELTGSGSAGILALKWGKTSLGAAFTAK